MGEYGSPRRPTAAATVAIPKAARPPVVYLPLFTSGDSRRPSVPADPHLALTYKLTHRGEEREAEGEEPRRRKDEGETIARVRGEWGE